MRGIHAEGPFVNPVKKGGMLEDRIQKPNAELVRLLHEVSGGKLKIMTMAPEREGIGEVIDCCKEVMITGSLVCWVEA